MPLTLTLCTIAPHPLDYTNNSLSPSNAIHIPVRVHHANTWMLKEFLINSAFHSDLHVQTNIDCNCEGIVSIAKSVLFSILKKKVMLDVDLDIPVYLFIMC